MGMILSIAVFGVFAAVGVYITWKLWGETEADLALRFARSRASRVTRGSTLAALGILISTAFAVAVLLITVVTPGFAARIVGAALAIGWIGSTLLTLAAIRWGKPSILVLPSVRDHDACERIVLAKSGKR